MTNSQDVLSALSLLRRHARILTGDRASADKLVAQAIACAGRSARLRKECRDARGIRVALFSAFQTAAKGLVSRDVVDMSPERGVGARLLSAARALPPVQRDVVLLAVVAGFTPTEVADIMAIPTSYVQRMLALARRTLHRNLGARVLLIEDDPAAATDLEQLVRDQGHTVVGIANSLHAALDLARLHLPELVLADVQLHGDDAVIAATAKIRAACDSAVIFVTGYPERIRPMLSAHNAIILRKPVEPAHLKACIRRVLTTNHGPLVRLVSAPRLSGR
jgi:DNA-directed RNA polymerase specialized sigma24 family protein/CheY-like chemotaxis protein